MLLVRMVMQQVAKVAHHPLSGREGVVTAEVGIQGRIILEGLANLAQAFVMLFRIGTYKY